MRPIVKKVNDVYSEQNPSTYVKTKNKLNTILEIDTSHSNYSLAIINSNGVLSEINTIKEEKPSEKLIELIEKSLIKANLDLHDLDCIAVGVGPGNFTGIH